MASCKNCRWADTCYIFTGKGIEECFALEVEEMQDGSMFADNGEEGQ